MKKSLPKSKSRKQQELNELFTELRAEYIESFHEKVTVIETLWQQCNRDSMEDEFHKIKGTGTTYGLSELSKLGEIMEDLCANGSPKVGLGVMISLEIFCKLIHNTKSGTNYTIAKDPLFKRLRRLTDDKQSA